MATATVTLDKALEIFGKLSGQDQDTMLEIAHKRRVDSWREEVSTYTKKALRDHQAGKLKSVARSDLKGYLQKFWRENDA